MIGAADRVLVVLYHDDGIAQVTQSIQGGQQALVVTLVQPDPTWELEYQHFKKLCAVGKSNIENDIWINTVLNDLTQRSLGAGK